MDLILIVLRFLWGLRPWNHTDMQLAPVPVNRRAAASRSTRTVRCFWFLGWGWLTFHPLFRFRKTALRLKPEADPRSSGIRRRTLVRPRQRTS
jgi:hypothetical protein